MSAVIEVSDLVYEYPRKRALKGVSFSVESGTVVALVGPNGAGKTTLLRCLAALDVPYSGLVTIAGIDTQNDPRAVHSKIGYLSDFFGLYEDLTVSQALSYMALVRDVAPSRVPSEVARVTAELKLSDYIDTKGANLSRGLKQRLGIGQATVHRPSVLLLDEPAAGLDPEARKDLSSLILKFKAEGVAVIVSSHILSELEDYSDRMLMLQDGRIVADEVVKPSTTTAESKVRLKIKYVAGTGDEVAVLTELGAIEVARDGNDTHFTFSAQPEAQSELLRLLIERGVRVTFFGESPKSMEAVYLANITEGAK